jgi:hypothetical protein
MTGERRKDVQQPEKQRQGVGGRHGEEKRSPAEVTGEDGCAMLGLGQRAVERRRTKRKEWESTRMKEE